MKINVTNIWMVQEIELYMRRILITVIEINQRKKKKKPKIVTSVFHTNKLKQARKVKFSNLKWEGE